MSYFRREHQVYEQVARHKILTLHAEGDRGRQVQLQPDPRHSLATELASLVLAAGVPAMLEVLLVGHFLAEGPKFFEFDARSCEALEHFSLELPSREYAQPFPTLMLKLPADYARNRVVRFEQAGESGEHRPDWLLIRHEPAVGRVLLVTHMTSDQFLTLSIRTNGDETLESAWQESHKPHGGRDHCLSINPAEMELNHSLSRLALSACLLLMVYGHRKVGHDNPSHADRLQRHLERARKGKDPAKLAAATWDLKVLPVRYAFAQEVNLYRRERQSPMQGAGEPSGRVLSPHWRRGFVKMQHYGPGNTLGKRIAIPCVLVNEHLFVGDPSQAQGAYRVKGGVP